ELRDVGEPRRVPIGDPGPTCQDLIEAVDLRHPERGAQLVETVVVAEASVREPAVEHVAALIAQAAEERVPSLLGRDDHAALAGRDLLVGVEGEHAGLPQAADRPPTIAGADRLAGVLDDGNAVRAAEGENGIHVRRLAEDVHGKNRAYACAVATAL